MIVEVSHSSQVATARRGAVELAVAEGLDEERSGRVALITTEMATNLLKHAVRGEIIIDKFADSSGAGIEVLAIDKGPGIANLGRAFEDGYSTAGSPGTGLGAIRRQADQFEIFSRPSLGTAIVARVRHDGSKPGAPGVLIGAVMAPCTGETVCGDGWAFGVGDRCPTLLAVDGSGHGPQAELAANAAVAAFREHINNDCTSLVRAIHRAMAPTRGGAVAVARVDQAAQLVRYVGVGNIAGRIAYENQSKQMVSNNGIAGHVAPTLREFTYSYTGSVMVVLHSDGLSAKWDFGAYAGLTANHPSAVAGVLFRDHRRMRDDALVVTMRV